MKRNIFKVGASVWVLLLALPSYGSDSNADRDEHSQQKDKPCQTINIEPISGANQPAEEEKWLKESRALADQLFEEKCRRQGRDPRKPLTMEDFKSW